jgi:hypothetical protein
MRQRDGASVQRIPGFASRIICPLHSNQQMRLTTLDAELSAIDTAAAAVGTGRHAPSVERFRADLAAARFHLRRPADAPPLMAILGGTGTGKSTLLNRLLGAQLAAASFRRTFTAGPIAVSADAAHLPPRWLGVEHEMIAPADLPARGRPDHLAVILTDSEIVTEITLIDTPDLDGDQPLHHAQADRVFRWADAVLFVVTPEKYQMTELLPYYRLARRYEIGRYFVMNKVEEQAVVDDYREHLHDIAPAAVYAIPRDDAAYEPPSDANLEALRSALRSATVDDRPTGNAMRVVDLLDRLRDQIIQPVNDDRREADRLIAALRGMETAPPGVDVNPLTQQLQRRLQQRSVLYLIGPGRVLDRLRQVPQMLARLPRTTWDLIRNGRLGGNGDPNAPSDLSGEKPNFRTTLIDQFAVVQSRIDDLIRANSSASAWIEASPARYAESKLNPELAGAIVDEELASLQQWLEHQWNATPRDTAMIEKLLRVLPGGQKLTRWSEAAPYLLAVVVATHHAFFGHIDLLILGGYSLATWLTERVSNQVTARARQANSAIAARFTALAHQQIEHTAAWLTQQAPAAEQIKRLAALADRVSEKLSAATVQR